MRNRRRRNASYTAAVVASMRAGMDRPSTPAGDTTAAGRVAESLAVPARARRAPVLRRYVEGRTRFFDAAIADVVGSVDQVVIVGAGYDDRSVRFRASGVRFIEVDHPLTQRDKRACLDQLGIDAADVCFVGVDLAVDSIHDALHGVLDATASVAFICEAVMPYLRYERVRNLLSGLGDLSPSGADLYLDPALLPDHPLGRIAFSVVKLVTWLSGEPLHTVLSRREMDQLFAATGWNERARTTGRELGMPRLAADSLYLRLSRT